MKRTKTSKAWMQQHVNDPYVQQAKHLGYRARSAFKLLEIDAKDHLLKPGMLVVDLGATPGGWSQIAAQKVGERGRVIALDLLEMVGLPGVTFIQGDFTEDATLAKLVDKLAGQPVDLVISDMAPNISGIVLADQARGFYLAELALEFAVKHLKPCGAFLVKAFQGGDFDAYLKILRTRFKHVSIRKPEASRSKSSEVYLVGKDLK
ncbi:MAG: RlmE family RNA methyltransferase [Pseudomonadota bacterium]